MSSLNSFSVSPKMSSSSSNGGFTACLDADRSVVSSGNPLAWRSLFSAANTLYGLMVVASSTDTVYCDEEKQKVN